MLLPHPDGGGMPSENEKLATGANRDELSKDQVQCEHTTARGASSQAFDAAERFRHEMLAKLGAAPRSIIGDGKLCRFSTKKNGRGDSGWYVFYDDDFPAGSFGDWRTGERFKWHARETRDMSPADRKQLEVTKAKRKADAEEAARKAIEDARDLWSKGGPAHKDSPYLARKKVLPYGIRARNSELLVPVHSDAGELISVQRILPNGRKLFVEHTSVAGGSFVIGGLDGASEIIIGEGYATCATLHEATALPVIVAFNAGNLGPVAQQIRERFPNTKIIIAVDDDHETFLDKGVNPGVRAAEKAARAVGGALAKPVFDRAANEAGSDWNDYAELRGKDAVAAAFAQAQGDHDKEGERQKTIGLLPWSRKANGELKDKSYPNAFNALSLSGHEFTHDTFHRRRLVDGNELSHQTCRELRNEIIRKYEADPGPDNVANAAQSLCDQNSFNPVVEYLGLLKWDGVKRVDRWLARYLGAQDTPLNRAIGRLLLVAMVRRAKQPGCKFDFVPILEGPQDIGKSLAIKALAGEENFTDVDPTHLDEKGQQETLAGVWIAELCELSGMKKADIDKTKAFITRTNDRARAAYGRFVTDQPRACIFVGTTNEINYLRDMTGNRRFWPVKVSKIDIGALTRDRDQLFAEAALIEAGGEPLILPADLHADAKAEQEGRVVEDPWEAILAGITGSLHPARDGGDEWRVHTKELFNHLDIPLERRAPQQAQRIAAIMRRLGWEPVENQKIGKEQGKGYRRAAQ